MTLSKARSWLRLLRDNRAVAMVEFALAAPVFIVLVMAGLEVANLALAHMRVSHIAMTVADNAGREESGIDESDIYEVFAGAESIGVDIDFKANGRVVLSSLEDNGKNGGNKGQTIAWQRCWGDLAVAPAYGEEGDGADDDELEDGLGPAGNKITAMSGTALMFVEATYDYQPLVGPGWIGTPRIRYESAFNVRDRTNNAITNTQSLTQMTCDDDDD